MSKLVQFEISCDLETFMLFFLDPSWYHQFLANKLEDLHVSVGDWTATAGSSNMTRKIRSFHPSKISFPGLPSHAESFKTQSMSVQNQQQGDQTAVVMTVSEINSFRDIPYADYFNVHLDWTVTCKRRKGSSSSSAPAAREQAGRAEQKGAAAAGAGGGDDESLLRGNCSDFVCVVEVFLEFKFFQSTWLQSTIESNTRSELVSVYETWRQHAEASLPWARDYSQETYFMRDDARVPFRLLEDISGTNPNLSISVPPAAAALAREPSKEKLSAVWTDVDAEMELPLQVPVRERKVSVKAFNAILNNPSAAQAAIYNNEDEDDEDDASVTSADMFYDAIEPPPTDSAAARRDALTLHSLHTREADPFYRMNANGEFQTPRDVAIRVVEMTFVLTAFLWWSVHDFYSNTIDLFSIDPSEFVGKVQDTFQYARNHQLTLLRPDLWGPVLAVFTLPHSLLLSLEVSKHGCNQASMLGSGVLVSLGMWMSLSLLYMATSFFFSVKLKAAHCFSVVGYSFFSWNVALLTSWFLVHALGMDQDGFILKLPLLVFGLPTSLTQGYLFYKNTFPVAAPQSSAITNRTVEFRGVVFTVRQIIKALVFVLIAGFHFNAFVYLAHVYLQEKRQTCHISFLIEFSKGFKFSPSFFLGE